MLGLLEKWYKKEQPPKKDKVKQERNQVKSDRERKEIDAQV
jgi:hypothetical protein